MAIIPPIKPVLLLLYSTLTDRDDHASALVKLRLFGGSVPPFFKILKLPAVFTLFSVKTQNNVGEKQ